MQVRLRCFSLGNDMFTDQTVHENLQKGGIPLPKKEMIRRRYAPGFAKAHPPCSRTVAAV